MAWIKCAEPEKEEVFDKVLVIGDAEFLRRESGFHLKFADA